MEVTRSGTHWKRLARLGYVAFMVGAAHQDYLRGVATEARFTFGVGLAVGVLFDREARREL